MSMFAGSSGIRAAAIPMGIVATFGVVSVLAEKICTNYGNQDFGKSAQKIILALGAIIAVKYRTNWIRVESETVVATWLVENSNMTQEQAGQLARAAGETVHNEQIEEQLFQATQRILGPNRNNI